MYISEKAVFVKFVLIAIAYIHFAGIIFIEPEYFSVLGKILHVKTQLLYFHLVAWPHG